MEMAGLSWPAATTVINTFVFLQVAQHSCLYAQNESSCHPEEWSCTVWWMPLPCWGMAYLTWIP